MLRAEIPRGEKIHKREKRSKTRNEIGRGERTLFPPTTPPSFLEPAGPTSRVMCGRGKEIPSCTKLFSGEENEAGRDWADGGGGM